MSEQIETFKNVPALDMILDRPIVISRSLRIALQSSLRKKLKINQAVRDFCKGPKGTSLKFEQLLQFIKCHGRDKRLKIPTNMKYNIHVRAYWKENPHGSHEQCVKIWNSKNSSIAPSSI